MKSLICCILLLSGYCTPSLAQEPTPADTCKLQSSIPTDSLTEDAQQFFDLMAQDSVWQEATAKDTLNFRVFGRYARDEAYYQRLTERFERADTTLFGSDFFILYYGYAYRDEYDGGYIQPDWRELIRKNKYKKAYLQVNNALKKAPATPHILFDALQVALELKRPEQEIYSLQWRLWTLLGWIQMLGNGSEEAPFSVVNIGDEYTIMYILLGVERVKEQALVENCNGIQCDCMEVVPGENSHFKESEVWFDISFPFPMLGSSRHWAKKITEEANEKN